jgi:hypothetical protein
LPSTNGARRLRDEAERYDELLRRHVSECATRPPAEPARGADDLLVGLALQDAAQNRLDRAQRLVRRDQVALGAVASALLVAGIGHSVGAIMRRR